jgi:hypothetical protein
MGIAMGHPNSSINVKEVKADQREEEALTQLEFSIVITALVTILSTLAYCFYISL